MNGRPQKAVETLEVEEDFYKRLAISEEIRTPEYVQHVPLAAMTVNTLTHNQMKTLTYRHCPVLLACFLSSLLSHLIQTAM